MRLLSTRQVEACSAAAGLDAVRHPGAALAARRRWPRQVALGLTLCAGLLGGCHGESTASASASTAKPAAASGTQAASTTEARVAAGAESTGFRSFSLTIYGYNYTDRPIGSFEVNGRGGGNLAVSSPTSGGGKSACCAAIFTPLPPDNTVRIKWSRGDDIWCELDVPFTGPVPTDAEYFEVHFHQDGRIELAATALNSPPRLRLERHNRNYRHAELARNVNNDDRYGRCKRGY